MYLNCKGLENGILSTEKGFNANEFQKFTQKTKKKIRKKIEKEHFCKKEV